MGSLWVGLLLVHAEARSRGGEAFAEIGGVEGHAEARSRGGEAFAEICGVEVHAEARSRGGEAFGDVLLMTLLVISSLAWRAISLKYAELSVTRRRGDAEGRRLQKYVEAGHAEARSRGEGAFGDVLLMTLLVISSLAWRAISVKYTNVLLCIFRISACDKPEICQCVTPRSPRLRVR